MVWFDNKNTSSFKVTRTQPPFKKEKLKSSDRTRSFLDSFFHSLFYFVTDDGPGPNEHQRNGRTGHLQSVQTEIQSHRLCAQTSNLQALLLLVLHQIDHDEGHGGVLR